MSKLTTFTLRALILLSASAAADLDPALPEAPAAAETAFHFIVLGDSQFDDPDSYNRTIDQVRLLGPAFVIQVGDLIDGYVDDLTVVQQQWRRFRKQIAPLAPIPFYAVPGNHDVFNGERQVDPRLEQLFVKEWGSLHYRFRYGNAVFIILNSDSSQAPNGIDPGQRRWLSSVLEGEQATHQFVFLHRPPRLLSRADELHELFVRHGVDYVIYGHHHHYHHEVRDGVHYVMTNNSGDGVTTDPRLGGFDHLLQIAVRDQEISLASVEIDAVRPIGFVSPSDNYDYFELQRRLLSKTVSAQVVADGRYRFKLELRNPTERAIDAYLACSSQDNRWSFTPGTIPVLEIPPEGEQTVALEASYAPYRVPESAPYCQVKVPYQTSGGEWLMLEQSATIITPTATPR